MQPERILRRDLLKRAAPLAAAALPARADEAFQIGAYYFPGYHPDPRTAAAHGPGWTEWELVKRAEPRFPGHRQPNQPLWGFEDESDPRV
ncbi:MAG TPA: glycoside hydrolase family 99-like domain-containing protein, partial [Bryobacteraceae bacterium]